MNLEQALIQMSSDMAALKKRLAPDNATRQVAKWTGFETAANRNKTLQFSGPFNTIQVNLLKGRILVYLDFHGDTNAAPDFVLDASNNAVPIHFPALMARSMALVPDPNTTAPRGAVNVYLY